MTEGVETMDAVEAAVLAVLSTPYTKGRFAGSFPILTATQISDEITKRNFRALVAGEEPFSPHVHTAQARRAADALVRQGKAKRLVFRDMKATVHFQVVPA